MTQVFINTLNYLREYSKEVKRKHEEVENNIRKIIYEETLKCDHLLPDGQTAFTHWSCTICGKESSSAANR